MQTSGQIPGRTSCWNGEGPKLRSLQCNSVRKPGVWHLRILVDKTRLMFGGFADVFQTEVMMMPLWTSFAGVDVLTGMKSTYNVMVGRAWSWSHSVTFSAHPLL